jgi:hypothetical protein
MLTANQNPEQLVRDQLNKMLVTSGWLVQAKKQINLSANKRVAVREYQTNVGPADYLLFVNQKPAGVIEAKREEEGVRLTVHEDQSSEYATAKLKYLNNDPLPFKYDSTGEVTRFTDYHDPKPRSTPVFTFHPPEGRLGKFYELFKDDYEKIWLEIGKTKEEIQKPKDGIAKPKDRITKPKDGIAKPKDRITKPKDGIAKPKDGIAKPKDGIAKSKDRIAKLKDGIAKPKDGIAKLKDGIAKPKDGIAKLKDGIAKPKDGIAKPKDGIEKPKDETEKRRMKSQNQRRESENRKMESENRKMESQNQRMESQN